RAMPRVTRISVQQRHSERVNVFIDEEFAFGLDQLVLSEAGIAVGDELDTQQIEALKRTDDVAKALNDSLRLFAGRPRSTPELPNRLKHRGYDTLVIDSAIEQLRARELLDDSAFAAFWVENREANRPRGRRLLEVELRQKGVDRNTAR